MSEYIMSQGWSGLWMNIYINIDKESGVYNMMTFSKVSFLHNKCAPQTKQA